MTKMKEDENFFYMKKGGISAEYHSFRSIENAKMSSAAIIQIYISILIWYRRIFQYIYEILY